MAKGNMLQGMATGKLGDVVFARANGEQISRVRNRHPKNPRSNKQMYQRAVMATVMQAYSAGQEIFNHAFQGKSVGAENQRAFLSKNSKLLRGLIAAEIEAGTAALNCNAAVVAPGAINPVPNEYMISEGSYPCTAMVLDEDLEAFTLPTPETEETLVEYASTHGFIPGDIYTICVFSISGKVPTFSVRDVAPQGTGVVQPSSQYPCIFAFVRMQVKDVSASATLSTAAKWSDLFEVTAIKNATLDQGLDKLTLEDVFRSTNLNLPGQETNDTFFTMGVIRSRVDQDLRSTSFMSVLHSQNVRQTKGMYGITSPLALAAWQQGTEALGDSDLILEGGDE